MPAGQTFALGGHFIDRCAAAAAVRNGLGLLALGWGGSAHGLYQEKSPRCAGSVKLDKVARRLARFSDGGPAAASMRSR